LRVLKTKLFARFARRERIEDAALCLAIERANKGLIDADLGGGVIKLRVARMGEGRSGGYRTLVAFRFGGAAYFMFGFAKKDQGNIDAYELAALRRLAALLLPLGAAGISRQIEAGELQEVMCHGQDLPQ
jgi:hypothetical protein